MKLLNRITFVLIVGLFGAQTANAGKSCATLDASDIRERASKYQPIFDKYSKKYGVDSRFITAIVTNESCFKPRARSHAGAKGLMQLMPAAAKRFGVKDRYDPDQNVRGGTRYLAFLIKRFDGDMKKVIAGYHAGEGNVAKYGGVPPFRYTRGYVKNVTLAYTKLGGRKGRLVLNKPEKSAAKKPAKKLTGKTLGIDAKIIRDILNGAS